MPKSILCQIIGQTLFQRTLNQSLSQKVRIVNCWCNNVLLIPVPYGHPYVTIVLNLESADEDHTDEEYGDNDDSGVDEDDDSVADEDPALSPEGSVSSGDHSGEESGEEPSAVAEKVCNRVRVTLSNLYTI